MDDVHGDLQSYYDEEARQRLRPSLSGPRLGLREDFAELLLKEGRRSVVDYGSGPGLDGPGFEGHGIAYVGLDVAHGNAKLAVESGLTVLHGSIAAPPIRPESFDAGWSMSTLMHIPEAEVPGVVARMADSLRSGAPLLVGLWGARVNETPREHVDVGHIDGHQRMYSLRSLGRNRELLEAVGDIDSEVVWDVGGAEWEYQIFQIRIDR